MSKSRRSGFADWVLRRAAGEERGAAIYGDLVELAASRGRGWFWAEYARTLVALTWRVAASFAAGLVAFGLITTLEMQLIPRLVYFHLPHAWRFGPFGRSHMVLYNVLFRLLAFPSFSLSFLAPYAAIRYGWRDRMALAGTAIGVAATSAFSLTRAWPLEFLMIAVAITMMVAMLLSSSWRPALACVAVSVTAGVAAQECLMPIVRVAAWYAYKGPRWMSHPLLFIMPTTWLIMTASMVAMVVVSAWMHARFMQEVSGWSDSPETNVQRG